MPSLRSYIVRMISRQYMKKVTPYRDVKRLRAGMERRTSILAPAAQVAVSAEQIAGVDCEVHVPAGCDNAPLIYYLHGGAYVMGSPRTHRRLVSHIAREAGMRAIVPDYRLAPEHRYPAAHEDSLAVYRALLAGGMTAGELAIGGDSAGGNLAMGTLLSLRDAGEPLPRASVLLSPWLDLTGQGETYVTRARKDPWFEPGYLAAVVARVCDEAEAGTPVLSPVFADAAGLPATLIQVGDHEILLSDSTRMAANLEASGVPVELQVWPYMWHVFQFFIGQMPESKRAIADIGRFLRAAFASAAGELDTTQAA